MGAEWAGRRLHFVGIGGAGMSGLALVCRELGATVGGSDRADSSYMERVRAAGIEPAIGHDVAHLPPDAEVVVSTAIAGDNPELAFARERGQVVHHRGELLAELCGEKRLIAVAGTHGKTTTTAMIVWALTAMGEDPAFFVGGQVSGLGGGEGAVNSAWGNGDWVVAEADESDASFLDLEPQIAAITNIELDHHSRWRSLAELTAAFERFVDPAAGVALPVTTTMPLASSGQAMRGVDVLYGRAARGKRVVRFAEDEPGPPGLGLRVPGAHNLRNARAALAAIELAGFDLGEAAAALAEFPGVHRRLEFKGLAAGAEIYDDYGHHPTEVRAVLEALRERSSQWLIAVFQPHLYSRTKALAEQFGAALAIADEAIVLDVYPAREEPVGELAGVSGLDVARAAADRLGGKRVTWAPDLESARAAAARALSLDDALVTIGAGDVVRVAEALVGDGGVG